MEFTHEGLDIYAINSVPRLKLAYDNNQAHLAL